MCVVSVLGLLLSAFAQIFVSKKVALWLNSPVSNRSQIGCRQDKMALVAVNGKNVGAEFFGVSALITNRTRINHWETFDRYDGKRPKEKNVGNICGGTDFGVKMSVETLFSSIYFYFYRV
jgi:hypothetical protein